MRVLDYCHAQDADWTGSQFGIQVIDSETGRGVPLVQLRTSGEICYWTDSAGWIAFCEDGLMDQEVFFHIDSPGYEFPADGFGYRGIRVNVSAGESVRLEIKRTNLAERLYRVTGQGIFRDSRILEQPAPQEIPSLNAGVIGQDSVQMVLYRGQLFWLWGDTNLPHYPLGNFRVTAATSPLPSPGGWHPDHAIPLRYFTDPSNGRVRSMLPDDQPGAVWLFGLINLQDTQQNESLVAHYSRHLRLGEMVEHGLAIWSEDDQNFRKLVEFDLNNEWQHPRGQALIHSDEGRDYIYFVESFATTRVPAALSALADPECYESWSWDENQRKYVWQRGAAPATQLSERLAIDSGQIPVSEAHFQVVDAESQSPVQIHRASINWNALLKRWILIGCQIDPSAEPSYLGEIWYAEADSITGPWRSAIKIASHPKYSFYNPRHHVCLDQEGGRYVYFEGTYTQMFSAAPVATPRYDYNQIMYRLDVKQAAERLR